MMGAFGLWVAASTIYYALSGSAPRAGVMGVIGSLALAANAGIAVLLYQFRRNDSQALSVWLCTRNDVLANLAVIAAGGGVWFSATRWPDILVAAVIASLALSSAVRVTRQALGEMRVSEATNVTAAAFRTEGPYRRPPQLRRNGRDPSDRPKASAADTTPE